MATSFLLGLKPPIPETPTNKIATQDATDSNLLDIKNRPSISAERPTISAERPSISAERPSISVERPSISAERSPISAERPSISAERPSISAERLSYLKKLVEDALKEHRVFTIKGGWQTLRRAFLKRNWIEKFEPAKPSIKPPTSSCSSDDICSNLPQREQWESPSAHIAKCERTIMSRLLQMHEVDFYWNTRKDQHDVHLRMNYHKMINRFSRSLFTSKEGLCLLLQQMYWHNEPGVADVCFPRCYVLGFPDHFNNFVDDFRLTACMSLMKFVVNKYDTMDQYVVQSPEGTVPYGAFQFALERLNEYLAARKHLDIDLEIPPVAKDEWDEFLGHFEKVVHEDQLFLESKQFSLIMLITAGKAILKNLALYRPQINLDGMKNIWIMKPGNKCRGRGIQLVKDVKDVAKIMELKLKYVVQKYIERPLIIYNTKFDIRQWFLITSTQPLQIWMYRDSYLRFSSQNFNLENLHESLHLTNHAVQCKYKNHSERDKALPEENMWDCHEFKEYLQRIGQDKMWDLVIFPGMKESIIGSMLACQDTMDRRPNTFELYGADFILAEDFRPWLLEINSSPDLSSSTSVTAKMCPQCLEDLVKVVIDKRKEPNCDTGLFDLIYKQPILRSPAYLGMSLSVRGRRIFKKPKSKKDKENEVRKSTTRTIRIMPPEKGTAAEQEPSQSLHKKYSGPIIADLMEELQKDVPADSDGEKGVEIASPVKLKKRFCKVEARVSRHDSHRAMSKFNKRNCSPSRKSNAKENSRIPRTAPLPRSTRSRIPRGSFGLYNEWALNRPTLNSSRIRIDDDIWNKSTVSILKGRNGISKINKESEKKYCVTNSSIIRHPILHKPISFGPSKERNLLTIGYGLGLPHLPRPYT